MTTYLSTIASFQNASNAVAVWTNAIALQLAAAGWVRTSNTGQLNTGAAIAFTATANYNYGYQIWKMGDSLTPIYLKIEYCNGATIAWPSIFVTIGTGTNGAGTLTGIVSPRLNAISSSSSAGVTNVLMSGDISRFGCVMPVNQGYGIGFAVERSKNLAGADTEDGAHLIILGTTPRHFYLPLTDTYRGIANALTALYPTGQTSLVKDALISLVPLVAYNQDGIRSSGLAFLVYSGNDISTGTQFNLTVYGLTHNYYALGIAGAGAGGPYPTTLIAGSPATALAIRFE